MPNPSRKNIFVPNSENITQKEADLRLYGRFIRLKKPSEPGINDFIFGEVPKSDAYGPDITYHKDLVVYAIENGLALEPKLESPQDDESFVINGGLADAGFFMVGSAPSGNLIRLGDKSSHYQFGGEEAQRNESKKILELILPGFQVIKSKS